MIHVYCGSLSNLIFAAPRIRPCGNGQYKADGRKDDVTSEAIVAVREHVNHCRDLTCACWTLFAKAPAPARAEAPVKP